MRRKDGEQREARRLRAEGYSLRAIAAELGVALSSTSTWTRDVERPIPEPEPKPVPPQRPIEWQVCGRCRERLPTTAFNKYKYRDGRQYWCRECFREYFRTRGQLHRHQVQRAKEARRDQARAYVVGLLRNLSCLDCGEDDLVVLEFDHVRDKLSAVSLLVVEGAALERVKAETAKCDVVCVNCHRRRTASRARTARWRYVQQLEDLGYTRKVDEIGIARGATRERNARFLFDFLSQKRCVDCEISDLLVLEFDHVRDKRELVTKLANRECSLKTIRAEIAKCEVRCANCHRRRTAKEQGHFRHHVTASVAQLVEQRAFTATVAGSTPAGGIGSPQVRAAPQGGQAGDAQGYCGED